MAVVNRNSSEIADIVVVPRVPLKSHKGPGSLLSVVGYVANAADDTVASIHRFVRVPSNARVSAVLLSTDDATVAGNIDVGVYQTVDNGGAVVDADLFASAFALTNGPITNSDITNESGEYTPLEQSKALWEVLGLSADPKIDYDIAATITTTYNGAAVGQTLKVSYVL